MSPNASHRVRPGLSSAASLMTTLLISFDQEVLNQHLNLVTPEYPFFESPWVAHSGPLTSGSFVQTLVLTDAATAPKRVVRRGQNRILSETTEIFGMEHTWTGA